MSSIFRPRTMPHGAVKTCVFTAPCAFYLCIYSVRDYLRKPRLRIIAGSLALPEQIWKKQITLRTRNIQLITPYATGTIIVQKRSATHISMRMLTTVNLSACLTWNMVKGDLRLAKSAMINAYRAEKITEHGKNLVVGNILRVKLCGVVVGVALRRNGGVLGILRLCLSGFGNARAAVGAKCGSIVKLYVAIRTCFHNIVSLVLYNSHCPTKRLCRAMFFIISLQTIT